MFGRRDGGGGVATKVVGAPVNTDRNATTKIMATKSKGHGFAPNPPDHSVLVSRAAVTRGGSVSCLRRMPECRYLGTLRSKAR